ncbi:MAG TPA: DUF2085 domain-containing protein, partial [Mobilitalea sp.]|nr:DUF2085 domain-containing protein [Mobilitalea sp.]
MRKQIQDLSYLRWRRWMEWGAKTGCHQRPDRSFFIKGYQMPVCARCFGVIIGYIIALPSIFLFGFQRVLSIAGCITMLIDWLIQAA